MAKYKIWDKVSDIYTLGKDANGKSVWTASEYIAQEAPWLAQEGAKAIISGGVINGMVFMEYEATKAFYKRQGAAITDDMDEEQVLAAIEEFEDNPPKGEPSAEERIAAAMEYQNIMSM